MNMEEDNRYVMPLGKRLIILHRAIIKKIDERAQKMELTASQLRVLGEISRLKALGVKEINQRDLENSFRVTHPTMTGIIQRLEKKGFVYCCPCSTDKRYKNINCTEQYSDTHVMLAEIDIAAFSELCKGLTREQIKIFSDITDIMLKNAAES